MPTNTATHCTWSIATTVRAPAPLVMAFVAHHLWLGAEQIFLFFDDPDDPAIEWCQSVPQVVATPCGPSYWHAVNGGIRPDIHHIRQLVNANQGKLQCQSAWIAHIDIDEFLHTPRAIAADLSDVPERMVAARLEPAEVMFHSPPATFAEALRGPFKKKFPAGADADAALRLLYGDLGPHFRHGLQGHTEGKVFVRTGSNTYFSIHNVIEGGAPQPQYPAHATLQSVIDPRKIVLPARLPSVTLLHFFALGYAAWCEKYERRLDPDRLTRESEWKRQKWSVYADCQSRGNGLALYQHLNQATPAAQEILARLGCYMQPDLDLMTKVRKLFGQQAHHLDAAL